MDEAFKTLGPLIGLVLGALLSGITSYFKARAERKRVIATALADLLEIRHRLVAADLMVKRLTAEFGASPAQITLVRSLQDQLLPGTAQLDERYDNAVTLLSGIAPVLGFTLRSKNSFPKVLSALRNIATSNNADLAQFETFESSLRAVATPSLEEAILELASAHSLPTWLKVKKLLANSAKSSPEVDQFFATMKNTIPPEKEGQSQQKLP